MLRTSTECHHLNFIQGLVHFDVIFQRLNVSLALFAGEAILRPGPNRVDCHSRIRCIFPDHYFSDYFHIIGIPVFISFLLPLCTWCISVHLFLPSLPHTRLGQDSTESRRSLTQAQRPGHEHVDCHNGGRHNCLPTALMTDVPFVGIRNLMFVSRAYPRYGCRPK